VRVLWVGDSPTVSTGFARCTRAVCGELVKSGHEVFVLGISANGDPHRYPYDIFPAHSRTVYGESDLYGVLRLPSLVKQLKPDVVVLLNDPWNVGPYMDLLTKEKVKVPVIGWLAVDARNHPRSSELNQLAHLITWTQFAIDELRLGGYEGTSSIVPLGVNSSVFYPRDRATARRAVCPEGFPEDAFVVGVVGRNQPRKRIDLAMRYFAEFIKRYGITNAYLYMHIAPTGEKACDIRALAAYYGDELVKRVFTASPSPRSPVSEEAMALVYSSFDVCLTTTQGEGWGLTTHEAMACGVPCVVPDWSALGEWTEDAAVKIPCTSTALSAPLNDFPYTVGGIPDGEETVKALWRLYAYAAARDRHRELGLELTARPRLQWDNVGVAFRRELESVMIARQLDAAMDAIVQGPPGGIDAPGVQVAPGPWPAGAGGQSGCAAGSIQGQLDMAGVSLG